MEKIKIIAKLLLPFITIVSCLGGLLGYKAWQVDDKLTADTIPLVGQLLLSKTQDALQTRNVGILQSTIDTVLRNHPVEAVSIQNNKGFNLLQEGATNPKYASKRFAGKSFNIVIQYKQPKLGIYLAIYGLPILLGGSLLLGYIIKNRLKQKQQIDYAFSYTADRLIKPHETLKNDSIILPGDVQASFRKLDKAIDNQLNHHITSEAQLHGMHEVTQEANKAKGRFLAQMTHEIRTPINGVLGMINLLQDSGLNEQQARLAATAKNSGLTLLNIINDLLDFAKIDAGRMDMENNPYNIRDVIEEVVELVSPSAFQKNVEVGYVVDPEIPITLEGDAVRIRQILANLAGNAVKFTAKGEVGIYVKLDKQKEDEFQLQFSVRDTGIGIPESDKKYIFQAFSQGRDSKSKHQQGTGLGLSIASQLASLLGGDLELDSQPGIGSNFHFTINQKETAQTEGVFEPCAISRVLVAANSNITQQNLEASLKILGVASIEVVDHLGEAITFLRQAKKTAEPYDVIFSDFSLKDVDGEELFDTLQEEARQNNNPMVVMAPAATLTVVYDYVDVERTPVLMKPVKIVDLQQAIAQAIIIQQSKEVETAPVVRETISAPASEVVQPAVNAKPVPAKPALLLEPVEIAEPIASAGYILVAEDNPVNAEVIKSMLVNSNYKVKVVENGKLAVQAVQEDAFDAVLMDGQMPVMDGLEATQEIRQSEEMFDMPRLPIIAVTANKVESIRNQYLREGMDDFITKPFDKEFLIKVLQKHLPSKEPEKQPAPTNPQSSKPAKPTPPLVKSSIAPRIDGITERPAAPANDSSIPLPRAVEVTSPSFNIDDYIADITHLETKTLSTMRSLQPHEGQQFVEKIIGIFIKDTEETIDQLVSAADQQNLEFISRTGHKIKSSSASIGALRLSKIAQWLEKNALTTPGSVPEVVQALEYEFYSVEELLKQEVAA